MPQNVSSPVALNIIDKTLIATIMVDVRRLASEDHVQYTKSTDLETQKKKSYFL